MTGDAQEPRPVEALRPGRLVGEQLAGHRRLRERAALHRHGAAVGFEKVEDALAGPFQGEHLVGHHSNASARAAVPHHDRPVERARLVLRQFVLRDKAHVRAYPAGGFKRDHHVGDEQGVFEMEPLEVPVVRTHPRLAGPVEDKGTLPGQTIDHGA